MIEARYIQKLMEDSAKILISSIVEFIMPYMPYLIGIISSVILIRLIKSSGNYMISYFGELVGYTKREITNLKKRFSSFVDLLSAFKDIMVSKK